MSNHKKPYQRFVCTYSLRGVNTDLYAVAGDQFSPGEGYSRPDATSRPRIKVRIDRSWSFVVGTLIHEAMEMVLAADRARYVRRDGFDDGGWNLFVFDHCQFTDACDAAGEFVCISLPKLAVVHGRFNKTKPRPRAPGSPATSR